MMNECDKVCKHAKVNGIFNEHLRVCVRICLRRMNVESYTYKRVGKRNEICSNRHKENDENGGDCGENECTTRPA